MKTYSQGLDLLLASVQLHRKGDFKRAARAFDMATRDAQVAKLMMAIDQRQQALVKAETAKAAEKAKATRATSLASALAEAAAKKKAKAKTKVKAKKVKAKKVKANLDGEQNFEDVLDDMTTEATEVEDDLDLSLDDIEQTLDTVNENVEELPVATGEDGLDDGASEDDLNFLTDTTDEELSSDDSDDDGEDEDDEEDDEDGKEETAEDDGESDDEDEGEDDDAEKVEESKPAVAKAATSPRAAMTRVNRNLQALSRLAKGK